MFTLATMNKVPLLLVFSLLISICAVSQNPNPTVDPAQLEENLQNASFREKFEAATSLMDDQLYELSLPIWENLIEEQPDNANLHYKYGYCLLRSNERRKEALPHLRFAKDAIVKNYNPFDFMEKGVPVETEFHLGRAYHHNYELDSAIMAFESFSGKIKKGKHILSPYIDLYIKQCNNAKMEIANKKTDYKITHLNSFINGHFDEYSPVITLDESALFFTSRRVRKDSSNAQIFSAENGKHFEDVYVSYKDPVTDDWGEAELLGSVSSPRANEATISVSADGMLLFIYKNEDIYISQYDGEEYGRIEYMGKESTTDINSDAWETHAALSADGNTLYFVSDREGGLGGRDIYRVVRLPNGEWSKALNIGPPINTPFDEDGPFFHPDGVTLFFSSNGEGSMGGFDIFFTKMQDDGTWSVPLNMGYPLNSVDDDVFFVTNAKGTMGYFASAKEDGGSGGEDIYTLEIDIPRSDPIAILKGYYVPEPGEPIPPNSYVLVTNLTEGGDPQNYTVRKRDGGYVMTLKPCNEYLVEYYADNEKVDEKQFEVPCEGAGYHEFGGPLQLGPVQMESPYHWQLMRNGEKVTDEGINANYMNKFGDVLYTEDISADGSFKFHKVDKEIFQLNMKNPKDCDKIDIVLMDDKGTEIRRMDGSKRDCIFGIDKPFDDGPKWRYQVLVGDEPLTNGHFVDYVDLTNGEHTWHEPVRDDGTFTFHKLPTEKTYAFEVWVDDPTLCEKMKINLLDENNKVVRTTTIDVRCKKISSENLQANYQEFFGYNEDAKDYADADWKKFIADCGKMVETNGRCHIVITGSASKVPTRTWKTNSNLASKRAEQGEKKVLKDLKKAGVDVSKVTIELKSKVSGPKYVGDFQNTKKYGPYQFVKLEAK